MARYGAVAIVATASCLAVAPAARAETFAKVETITVPAVASNATPYPSTISLSGLPGTVADLSVRVRGIDHTRPDDLDILLVAPGGQFSSILMSDVGGGSDLNDTDITFDDDAAASLPDGGPIPVGGGTFLPTDFDGSDTFPPPAPPGSYFADFTDLETASPNGTWSLYVLDDASGDAGRIDIGWSLNLTLRRENPGDITVPPGPGTASPYPATINVSGVGGTVTDVDAELLGVTHTFPDDLDVLLAGPGGQRTILMSDAGGGSDLMLATFIFGQSGATVLTDNGPIGGGSVMPADFAPADAFPGPAPPGPYVANLGVFSPSAPNGAWRLFVFDDAGPDAGSLSGWALAVKTSDTTSPGTTIGSGPSGPTNDPTASFGFAATEGSSQFQCRVDGGAFGPCSGPSTHTTGALADGAHSFEVRAIDSSLNVDPMPAVRNFVVDTIAPGTTIGSGPAGLTNDPTPSFGFAATEGSSQFQCRVDGGAFGPCSGPAAHTTGALADGAHRFAVRAIDPALNVDATPAARDFVVDATAPDTTIHAKRPGPTKDRTPTYRLDSSEGGSAFECALDGGGFSACSGPGAQHTTEALADGQHTISARSTDPAGNLDPSAASQVFQIDTTAPDSSIVEEPKGRTKTRHKKVRIEYSFESEAGASLECRLDDGFFGACESPFSERVGKGRHDFSVRAIDVAGNVEGEPAADSFRVVRRR